MGSRAAGRQGCGQLSPRIADADRQAATLNAQGDAVAIRLEGESRANVLRLNAEVLCTDALVVELVKADRWNGIVSQSLLEGTGATQLLGLTRQDNAGAIK